MIALFTDFGTQDAYVAQLKGAILAIAPHTLLLDLTHGVEAFDIREAAYLLELSTRYFPARMIFVAVVDPGVGTCRCPVLIRTQADKYYVGPDNGLFTQVVERETLAAAYALRETRYFRHPEVSATFHGRDIFGPVAAHLSLGVSPERFGPRLTDLVMLPSTGPQVDGKTVQGEIRHIDRFGNVVTNITPAFLVDVRPGQQLRISMAGHEHLVPFRKTYGDGTPGELICLINSDETFEIALPRGRAAACLAVQVGDRIVLEA
jgi:S-adenosylmethionine hydrolase